MYHWLALHLLFVILFLPLIVSSAQHKFFNLYDFIHGLSSTDVMDYLPLMHTLRRKSFCDGCVSVSRAQKSSSRFKRGLQQRTGIASPSRHYGGHLCYSICLLAH